MTDGYGRLFRKILLPAWERGVRGRPTLEHLASLRRSEWYSPDELELLQSRELRRLVAHAFDHVPHYRRRLGEAGVSPKDIRTVADLEKLPLLTRAEASLSFFERMSTAPPLAQVRKSTSGTTGHPLEIAYDRGSDFWRNAVRMRGYGWAGLRPGDSVVHYWGDLRLLHGHSWSKKAKIALDHVLRREHVIDCADRSDQALDRVLESLRQIQPRALVCYASAGVALARRVLETQSVAQENLTVICAAERVFAPEREILRRAFGPHVFETYGNREVMLIAAECPSHQGMHLSMENLIVEILVQDEGRWRAAEPGETGEVALTDLHNWGCPFIRYLTGDRASLLPGGRCACGRGLVRLGPIEGRTTETLHDGDGRPVGGMFFIALFSVMADRVRQFQVVQRKDGSIDLSLVPGRAFGAEVVEHVRRKCRQFIPGVAVRLHVVSDIPPSPSGKLAPVRVEQPGP